MGVISTLTFDSHQGPNTVWELDILDSDFTGEAVSLIGSGDAPITVTWHKDRDVYKPILGSSAEINVVIPNSTVEASIPDFNDGDERQYEVRLRYRRNTPVESSDDFLARIATNGGAELGLSLVTTSFVEGGQILFRQDNTALSIGSAWSDVTFFETQTTGDDDILDGVADGDPILVYGDDDNYAIYTINTSTLSNDDRATVVTLVDSVGTIPSTSNLYLTTGSDDISTFEPRAASVDSTFVPYWCGYIDPVASSEQFSTYPYHLTFKCVDGLGRLEQLTLDRDDFITGSDPAAQIPVFSYVTRTLRQTGLELPIYVESGFRTGTGTGTDALTTVTASAYSFFGEDVSDRRDARTYKDALEGTLSTFNCRAFQSAGAWWIVNASTHGGSGDTESATFTQYLPNTSDIVDYSVATGEDATVTFDLRYIIDGTADEELSVLDRDLVLTTRRRVGSYEARPVNLVQRPLHINDDFRNLSSGWEGSSALSSWSGNLPTGYTQPDGAAGLTFANDSFSDEDNDGDAWSIVTNINRQVINSPDELWFQTTNPFNIQEGSSTTIDIRWKTNNVSTAGRDPVSRRIPIRIRLDLDESITVTTVDTRPFVALVPALQGPQERTISTLYWDFDNEQWTWYGSLQSGNRGNPFDGTMSINTLRGGDEDVWQDGSITVDAAVEFEDFFEVVTLPPSTLTVEFYYPQATRNGRKVATENDTNRFRTFVDLVRVTDNFESEDQDPVFEHVAFTTADRDEVVATRTESYAPAFISSGVDTFRQFLSSTSYWRTSETLTDATTLEEKVTLQKLNDFADRFQYYEGSLLNRTEEPLEMHNKVLVNYTSAPRTTSCVLNGGTFNPKFNTWDIFMYVPSQGTDIPFGRYYETNVDLVGALFEGRINRGRYVLSLDVRGLNDEGAQHQTTDSEGREPGDTGYIATNNSLTANPQVISLTGTPGQIVEGVLTLLPGPGFEASASNLSILDSAAAEFTDETALDFITFGNLVDVGSAVEVAYTVRIPSRGEYESVVIQGEVDVEIANNRDFDITFALDNTVGNAVLTSTMRGLRGIPDTVSFANVIIAPSSGNELDATSFSVDGTLPAGVSLIGFSQLGTSVIGEFTITFQPTDQDVTITLTGDSGTALPTGVDTSVVTLDINESITNASTLSDFSVTGVQGSTGQFNLPFYAADGFNLDSDNFSAIITGSPSNITMYDAVGGGDSVQIPLRISFPTTASQTAVITVSGSAQPIGAETVDVAVTFTHSDSVELTETTETFTGVPGTSLSYSNDVIATSGNNLTALSIGTLTGDTGAVSLTATLFDGDDRGTIVGTINFPENTDSAAATDLSVTVPITTTTTAEPNTLFVNIANNIVGAAISRSQIQIGFGNDEIGDGIATIATDTERTFTVQATDAGGEFAAATDVTATGDLTINTGTIDSNGVITKMLTGVVPQPDAAGNAYANITLEGTLDDFFVDGLDTYNVELYRRSASVLGSSDTPENVTVTFGDTVTVTNTANNISDGWSASFPSTGSDPIYISRGIASSRDGEDDAVEMSTPSLFVENGSSAYELYVSNPGDDVVATWTDTGLILSNNPSSDSQTLRLSAIPSEATPLLVTGAMITNANGADALSTLSGNRNQQFIPVNTVTGWSGSDEVWAVTSRPFTQDEWINSLAGVEGDTGQSAYQAWLAAGNEGTTQAFLDSLVGDAGDSAYQTYVSTTTDSPVLSQAAWIDSLNGVDGDSAYEIYRALTDDDPVLTEAAWLASLDGENGDSAYQTYLSITSDNPVLSMADWISSLQGASGDPGSFFQQRTFWQRAEDPPTAPPDSGSGSISINFQADSQTITNSTSWSTLYPSSGDGVVWGVIGVASRVGFGTATFDFDAVLEDVNRDGVIDIIDEMVPDIVQEMLPISVIVTMREDFYTPGQIRTQRWNVETTPVNGRARIRNIGDFVAFGSQTTTSWGTDLDFGTNTGGGIFASISEPSSSNRSQDIIIEHIDDTSISTTVTATSPASGVITVSSLPSSPVNGVVYVVTG